MWQNATKLDMAQSVRITDEIYQEARTAASLLDRSVAQQIEHWIRLGRSIDEVSALESAEIQIKLSAQFARDIRRVRSGEISSRDLCIFNTFDVRKMNGEIHFDEIDLSEMKDDYADIFSEKN